MSDTARETVERLIAEDLFEQLRFGFESASDMYEAVTNCEPLRALLDELDKLRADVVGCCRGLGYPETKLMAERLEGK